ncbi:MAG: asparagine synthase (glutamine-hydrolyzing) [Chitinophagaceae bacterium]
MCGIVGVLAKNNNKVSESLIKSLINPINRRGPDSEGIWVSDEMSLGIGHKRLSILDLSEHGHQPMFSHSGRYILVYNGEIYNHLLIRKNIERIKNVQWRSTSDTETILECFELYGIEESLKLFEGMFALALWDVKNKTLTLARDRFGEKPLYYGFASNNSDIFIFGSDLASFKSSEIFKQSISNDSLALYFRYNYIPCPYTVYENTFKLIPGHFLIFDYEKFEFEIRHYWKADEIARKAKSNLTTLSFQDSSRELEELLLNVVKSQMISDVPIGAFLSGGVDSSLVASLMQANSSTPIKTFTIGFEESQYDESRYASKVASFLGTDHTSHIVTSNEAMSLIPVIQEAYSEPFADSSQIPTMLVSHLAKSKVTVSLSGDAGDEIFGGYNRYFRATAIHDKSKFLPELIKNKSSDILTSNFSRSVIKYLSRGYLGDDKLQKISSILAANSIDDVYTSLISHSLSPESFLLNSREPITFLDGLENKYDFSSLSAIERMMLKDTISYLPDDILVKVDRAAMYYSLETRVPMLNQRVFEYAWSLPMNFKVNNSSGKLILKDILSRYIPKSIFQRPKMGFGIPIDNWLKGDLKDWMTDLLSYDMLKKFQILNPDIVSKLAQNYLDGKGGTGYQLWNFVILQSWLNKNS